MKSVFITLLLAVCWQLNAQQPLADSAFYMQSVTNAVSAYKQEVQGNLHLYNGKQYLRTGHGTKGTPFFEADSLLPGTVLYDGRVYSNLLLHYDLVTDNVIINSYIQNNELVLVPEKLDYFSILDHAFVRITADSSMPSFITTGFYEKLYAGRLMLFAKRQKTRKLSVDAADNDATYLPNNDYYILLNNVFYQANDKNSFLALLADQKDSIRKFIQDNKINFNKKREAFLIKVAEYYSQLKN